jgi:leucyl aminopeptidase
MTINVEAGSIEQVEADALVVLGLEKDVERGAYLNRANELTGGWVDELYASGEFTGKALETALLHRPAGLKAKRLMVVGGGKSPVDVRRAAGAAVRALKPKGIRSIAFAFDGEAAAVIEGAMLGEYEPDRLKSERAKPVETLTVLGATEEEVRRSRIIADAQNFARYLANEPANLMTPSILSERARELAAAAGLECEILDRDRMKQMGMGALLGVAQGSEEAPALIVLRYKPASPAGTGHLALVGKAVTFDTGGISIKPSEGMEKMKYDMCGGAAAIAAMRALAELKPAVPVTAFIPAVENMPGGRAQRPGDIVRTLSGKTVEVMNTDAEGRLILADALSYARTLGCTHLVDAATLTGAIVVALGNVNTGVFASDEALAGKVLAAATAAGEKMWRMPLDEDYREQLKTPFADMPNIGTRWGGAITAAAFLQAFAEDTPWAHLDIAGTAWLDDAKPYLAKGPTGVAVRTFIELAMGWAA